MRLVALLNSPRTAAASSSTIALLILSFFKLTISLHPQRYVMCKEFNSQRCLLWPIQTENNVFEKTVSHWTIGKNEMRCFTGELTSYSPEYRFMTVKQSDKEIRKRVFCKSVHVIDPRYLELGSFQESLKGLNRVPRSAGVSPRGRYRGQTQSQYLAIDRGDKKDEGKAEAHSAADSSRATVSGNNGMGQAQSQSMYDPSCDDCLGRTDNEVGNLVRGPTGGVSGTTGYGSVPPQGWTSQDSKSDAAGAQPGTLAYDFGGQYAPDGKYVPNGGPSGQEAPGGVNGQGPSVNYRPSGIVGQRPGGLYGSNGTGGQGPGGYYGSGGVAGQGLNGQRGAVGAGPGGISVGGPGSSIGSWPGGQYSTSGIDGQYKPNGSVGLGGQYGQGSQSPSGQYSPSAPSVGNTGQSSPGGTIGQLPGGQYGPSGTSAPSLQRQYSPGGTDLYSPSSTGGYGPGTQYVPGGTVAQAPSQQYGPGDTGGQGPGKQFSPGVTGSQEPIAQYGGLGGGIREQGPGGQYSQGPQGPRRQYGPNTIGGQVPDGLYASSNVIGPGPPGGQYHPGASGGPGSSGQFGPDKTGGQVVSGTDIQIPNTQYIPSGSAGFQGTPYPFQYGYPGQPASYPVGSKWPAVAGSFMGSDGLTYICCVANPNNGSPLTLAGGGNGQGSGGLYSSTRPGGLYGPGGINGPYVGANVPATTGSQGSGYYGPEGSSMIGVQKPGEQYGSRVMGPGTIGGPGQGLLYTPGAVGTPESGGKYGPVTAGGPGAGGRYTPVPPGVNGVGGQYSPTQYIPGSMTGTEPRGQYGPGQKYGPGVTGTGSHDQYGPISMGVRGSEGQYVPGAVQGGPGTAGIYIPGTRGQYGSTQYTPGTGNMGSGDQYGPGIVNGLGGQYSPPGGQYGHAGAPGTSDGSDTGESYGPSPPGRGTSGQYSPGGVIATGPGGPGTSGQYGPGGVITSGPGTSGQYGPGGVITTGPRRPGTSGQYVPGGVITSGPGTNGPYSPGGVITTGPGSGGQYGPSGVFTTGPGGPGTGGQYSTGGGITTGPGTNGRFGHGGVITTGPGGPGTSGQYGPGGVIPTGPGGPGTSGQYGPGGIITTGPAGPGTNGQYGPGGLITTVPGGPGQLGTGGEITTGPGGPGIYGPDSQMGGDNSQLPPQNVIDQNSIADGDDSEAEASVAQAANGTVASAASKGGNDKGRAQTHVTGTYTGSGSFSAQAEITGENKAANSEVSGDKRGASSTAQGSGRNNKSQANVKLGSETGSVITGSQSEGVLHSSNSQVHGGVKGGMADAQARGPGSTSSQAQIGFTPFKEGDKGHDKQKVPFVGGGVASAQSNGRTGMSQSQLHGTFKYGITYNGAAQSGASLDKDAVFQNRLSFEKVDVFDENNKNINVDSIHVENTEDITAPPELTTSTAVPFYNDNVTDLNKDENVNNSEETYGSHSHSDHHPSNDPYLSTTRVPPVESRRSFKSTYNTNNGDYEYSTDKEETLPEDYDVDEGYGPDGNYQTEGEQSYINTSYNEFSRDSEATHQSLQNENRKGLEVRQTTGGNTQHILLGSLGDHDAEIIQTRSERPDENKVYQPGERIPGTGGYTIPVGFTGSVKSVASKDKTYVVGSKESPSQAQTVSLTPGNGKIKYKYSPYGRNINPKNLRSLYNSRSDDNNRYVSVSKSVTRDLDSDNNIRKQYSHTYYTKSSSCGYFTFTCTMVSSAEGKKRVCKPKIPQNPDGTPIRC